MNAPFPLSCLVLVFLVVPCSPAPQVMPAVAAGTGPTAAGPAGCRGKQPGILPGGKTPAAP
jgi:hypothetical protein